MSKKDKKKSQQKLSLKERLEKHWNNRDWAAFVSLFLRDREASARTPWASRWDNALYNCLTNALFVEKDLKSAEMVVDLIQAERGISGVSPLLCDCADVASDFLNAYQNGTVGKPSPLLEEARLPSSYAALRREFVFFSSLKTKTSPQNETENLVKKLATQYGKLGRAKTAIPYVTWMKIANELKDSTSGTECAEVFDAVHAIVTLVHKLVLTGKGENSLRDATSLLAHPVFRGIPSNQTHPVVRTLWEFFCQTGEQKYGKDWGEIARTLQLSFMKPLHPDLERLKGQYDRLAKMRKNEFLEEILQSALLIDTSHWTDQENYILRMFFVFSFRENDYREPKPFEVARFLESFKILGEIGRKWRPQSPWTDKIQSCFQDAVLSLPRKLLSTLSQWDLPYEAMTPTTLLYLALVGPYNPTVKEKITLPLIFSEAEMATIAENLVQEDLSRKDLRAAKLFLDNAGYIQLCEKLVDRAILLSAEDVANNHDPLRQFWFSLRRDMLEELAADLPSDTLEGCFCRMYVGAKSMRLSNDPDKVEAFFNAPFPPTSQFAPRLWMVLTRWPEIDPEFLVRLFKKNYPQIQTNAKENDSIWEAISYMIMKIKPKSARDQVANGVLQVMARDKNKSRKFKEAVAFLERLSHMTDAELAKKSSQSFKHNTKIPSFKQIYDLFNKMFQKNEKFPDNDL